MSKTKAAEKIGALKRFCQRHAFRVSVPGIKRLNVMRTSPLVLGCANVEFEIERGLVADDSDFRDWLESKDLRTVTVEQLDRNGDVLLTFDFAALPKLYRVNGWNVSVDENVTETLVLQVT